MQCRENGSQSQNGHVILLQKVYKIWLEMKTNAVLDSNHFSWDFHVVQTLSNTYLLLVS